MRVSELCLTVVEVFDKTEAKLARGEPFEPGEVYELLNIAKAIDHTTRKRLDRERFRSILQLFTTLCGSKDAAAEGLAPVFGMKMESVRRAMQPSRGMDGKGTLRLWESR